MILTDSEKIQLKNLPVDESISFGGNDDHPIEYKIRRYSEDEYEVIEFALMIPVGRHSSSSADDIIKYIER